MIRKITPKDYLFCYLLRIEKEAQRNSFFKVKDYAPYKQWIKTQQGFYIIIENGRRVGYIRINRVRDRIFKQYEVSICIHKDYRGKGIGKKSLSIVCSRYKNNTLIAYIKKFNETSMRCFMSNRFIIKETKRIKNQTIYRLERDAEKRR